MGLKDSFWHVTTENAFTQGDTHLAAPELARQIEERILAEGHHGKFAVQSVLPREGLVVVKCDDEFGFRLNDLPGASFAEKSPAVIRSGRKFAPSL